ncbi:ADP-ribose diphosphatase [Oleispira antarctica]|uniref:ADP-ribose pyrophosphatase n=1 Tax=Oleispira antarctica TaxID=188908 RepID=A0A1Y5HNV5_OLEAN|nr:ADP-ribose diphosphatase [Oleispira antarctica]
MAKSELDVKFNNQDHQSVLSKRLHDGFFKVDHYQIEHALFAGGRTAKFSRELFERGEASAVLLYDPVKDLVVLTEQYRIGAALDDRQASPWLLEVVAGMMEAGESAEDVARRESEEEAGCSPDELIPISSYWSSPGGTSEKVHLYCALIDSTGLGGIHGLEHEQEDILVRVVPFAVAYNGIESGEINNAATIIALQWLKLRHNELR